VSLSKYPFNKSANWYVLLHLLIVVPITIVMIFVYVNSLLPSSQLVDILSWTIIIIGIWVFVSWYMLTNKLFDPYILFMGTTLLFHTGQVFISAFKWSDQLLLYGKFSDEILVVTLLIVIIGVVCMHLGAMLGRGTGQRKFTNISYKFKHIKVHEKHIRLVGYALLMISIVPSSIMLRDSMTIVFSSGYFSVFQQEDKIGFGATSYLLSAYLVPASILLLAGSEKRRGIITLSIMIISIYVASNYILGYRGDATMSLIAYAWIWHVWIRPIPTKYIVIVGISLLGLVFPLVKQIREQLGSQIITIGYLSDTFSSLDNPLLFTLSEMGSTLRIVSYTYELVPLVRDFDWGVGYYYAMFTIIPNLFWDIHPTIAYGRPSNWLIWTVEPEKAALGGGNGFSFLAEAYMNFSWYGVVIVPLIIGILLGRLVKKSELEMDPAKLALFACIMVFLPQYARGDASMLIRFLVWHCFLPYLCITFLSSWVLYHKKRSRGDAI
jgi:oligosaccharide repeat unit polymerase